MDAYIVDAVRTARGKGNDSGALAGLKPTYLLAQTLRALASRNSLDTSCVTEAVFGCVTQTGDQGTNLAKVALLNAGWADSVPGMTVNRYCASALSALNIAAMHVATHGGAAVGGGVESMSRVPMGSDKGPLVADLEIILSSRLVHMGICADLVATLRGYAREQLDAYACESQRRAAAARREGRFARSLLPVKNAKGEVLLEVDEPVRENTTAERLAGLAPAFADLGAKGADAYVLRFHTEAGEIRHLHTAGNSPATADGASAVLLASEKSAKQNGWVPRARILSFSETSVDPVLGLTGAVDATRIALARAGLTAKDIDLFEVNESFAALMHHYSEEIGVSFDALNVNGGAIALGHAMGATGGTLMATLLDELERRDLKRGVVAICGAAGLAAATVIERV